MLKLFALMLGLAGGAAGTAAWLLSEPSPETATGAAGSDRLAALRSRLADAMKEGEQARADTENRLRHELDAFRHHPDRPAPSS